jgi:hypothetical protein
LPVSYIVDKAAGIIRTRCYGNVTLAEVLSHFEKLKNDLDSPNLLDVVLDLREMTSSPTAEQIRQASHGPAVLRGAIAFGCCAIVARRDVIFGMARMWAVFAEAYFKKIDVFRSVSEAEIWLMQCRVKERFSQSGSAP